VRQAIEACRRSGLHLKIAGPTSSQGYQGNQSDSYFRQVIEPLVDGKLVEYVGELGFEDKVDFLKNSRGLLFPVQWEEPFGLVVIEAMACGTPVLGLGRGSVPELVAHGETGYIACDMEEFEKSILRLRDIDPARCRRLVEERFSAERMADDYYKLYTRILRAEPIQATTSRAVSSHTSRN
jgi:glycosyltransferase involved in cell wall biosynthesis